MDMQIFRMHQRRAVLLSLAAAGIGCRADPVASDGALSVSMTADRTTATPAAPLQLLITITSRSRDTLTVASAQSYGCPPLYVVQDIAGRAIAPPNRVCLLIAYAPSALAPGAQMVITERWGGETRDANGNEVRVAPGVYRLRASVAPLGRVLLSEPITAVVP